MADQVITKQELIDAQKDAQTLEDAVNGEPGKLIKSRTGREFYSLASVPQINTMSREEVTSALAPKADKAETAAALDTKANQADTFLKTEVTSLVAPKADKTYVDSAIGAISTDASKQYATLALATADIANIALNKNIFVSEAANGGYWYKDTAGATSLTKSPYDPIQQGKNYADANPMFKPINIVTAINLNTITSPTLATVTNPTNITLALNFPVAGAIGTLEVLQGGVSATIFQKYTLIDGTVYVRGYTSGSWSAWVSQSVINKNYADANPLFKPINITAAINLNTVITPYLATATNPANITLALNFPVAGAIGTLEVLQGGVSATVFQKYTLTDGTVYVRSYTSGNWSTWNSEILLNKILGETNRNKILSLEDFDTKAFVRSTNIFNGAELGKSVDLSGNLTNESAFWLSDYYPIKTGEVFKIPSGSYRVIYYDENRNFITRSGATDTVTPPVSVARGYFRLSSTNNLATMQMNKGASLLPYEPYYIDLKNPQTKPPIEPSDTVFLDKSKNLFDKSKILVNTSISTTGAIETDPLRWLSDFMEFSLGETVQITAGTYRIALFDANKQFITRTGTTNNEAGNATYTNSAISLAKYLRISGTNNADEVMLNKGSTLLPFEKFGTFIKTELIPKIEQEIPVITPEMTNFFAVSKNLFDKSDVILGKTVDTSGNIVDDIRWLGGYIPCAANEVFSVPDDSFRIAYYNANKNFISRSGGGGGGSTTFTVSNVATIAYMRLSGLYDLDLMQVNRGATLLPYDTFGLETLKKEYLPTDLDIDTDALKEEIISEISVSNYEPSLPTLTLTKIEETWRQPLWLSSDGATLYGAIGGQLLQSTDDWVTRVNIGAALPKTILAVRVASDGQLLAATLRDEADGTVAKVYKTIGYDRANPSAATFKEVLAINSTQANITNQWGFSVYNNIVTVSEYGLRGDNGAKNVYLSKDNGDTFSLIFNQYTQVVTGRPELTMSAHMHTAAYDPYYNRIWVVVGDNPNTATYYSDDLGVTWVFVTGSTGTGAIQYTGIQAMPDCVIFGSDRSPNGIYVYRRNGKDKMPVIKPLLIINSSTELTHVFGLPFKRDWSPIAPTYFVADRTDGTQFKPMITATVDGKKGHIIGELGAGEALHGIFGATASGKIIVVSQTSTSAGVVISTANAPTWSKV